MSGRGFRGRIAAAGAIVAVGIPVCVVLVRGEDLLRHPEPMFWSIWVPALLLVLSLLLALSRSAAFFASMAVLGVTVVEFGFRVADLSGPQTKTILVAGGAIESSDSVASFGAIPGASSTMRRIADGETEYEVTYNIDSHGRRVTPVPEESGPEKAALFFGGSWMFGSGLDDRDTLAAAFSRLYPQYRSYNYGYGRYGPPQALDLIRARDLSAEIPEDVGLAIYLWTGADLARVIGTMRTATAYCRRCSNYVVDDSGAVVRDGDFSIASPLRSILFSLLEQSNVLEYLRVDLPADFSDADRVRGAAVIGAIRDDLAEIFPAAEFVLVVAPKTRYSPVAASFFDSIGLRVLNYGELYSRGDPRMRVSPSDYHPSAFANELIARQLVADLAPGLDPDRARNLDQAP